MRRQNTNLHRPNQTLTKQRAQMLAGTSFTPKEG